MSAQAHIVVIGGGTGTYTVLSTLRDSERRHRLSAIVSMADDGGSTGVLRDEMGVLPPGSVRPALIALAEEPNEMRAVFTHRFEGGTLAGHNVGNLILATLQHIHGDFGSALKAASRILNLQGEVVPSTLDDARLMAELEDGTVLRGESAIDVPQDCDRSRIVRLWFEPDAVVNPRVREVMQEADVVVVGPGDLYSSVLPNFIVRGMTDVVRDSRAPILLVCNLMNKAGETTGFRTSDFVREVERYLGRSIDGVLVNTARPPDRLREVYAAEGRTPVEADVEHPIFAGKRVAGRNFLSEGTLVRHHPFALRDAIEEFLV